MYRFVLTAAFAVSMCFGEGSVPSKKAAASKRAVQPKATTPKADTDLGPGEIACGREGHKQNAPCDCMKHRLRLAEEARTKCYVVKDEKLQRDCFLAAEVCNMTVRDVDTVSRESYTDDGSNTEVMPAQCSRSCSKARCQCCHT